MLSNSLAWLRGGSFEILIVFLPLVLYEVFYLHTFFKSDFHIDARRYALNTDPLGH